MKALFPVLYFCLSISAPSSLFDGIKFNKRGMGYKTNIPVIYHSFGKYQENEVKKLDKNFKTATTALSFIYNEENYYVAIEKKNFPDFLSDLKEGDLIFIDIVVFNVADCCPVSRSNKEYCSYITKIQQNNDAENEKIMHFIKSFYAEYIAETCMEDDSPKWEKIKEIQERYCHKELRAKIKNYKKKYYWITTLF